MLKAVATESLAASGITINSSVITGGTTGRFLYDNAGTVGETAGVTFGGTGIVAISASLAIGGATIGSNALAVTGTTKLDGNLQFTDATYDIGLSGSVRPRFIYASSNITAGAAGSFYLSGRAGIQSPADKTIQIIDQSGSNGSYLSGPSGTATLQFGQLDAAVAVAQTLRVQSVVAGTAAANGANWTLIGSLPTGTGTSGDIIFQTGVKTGSGTTQGTATTALTIKGETQALTIASGKSLVLGNAATTGLGAGILAALTNASIVISDANGQAYRIPCII